MKKALNPTNKTGEFMLETKALTNFDEKFETKRRPLYCNLKSQQL
jgi:hypothetical protein